MNVPCWMSVYSYLNVSPGWIARWLTPLRQQIEGVGVKPDIIVTPSDEDIDNRRDVQLFRAIDHLRGQTSANIP